MTPRRTEVLVVGAGPAGLLTALVLAHQGVDVQIIDREERTAARSYACALHPQILELLDEFGLASELLDRGRRINRLAFYDGLERRAELDLSRMGGKFPFLCVVPQSDLETVLERKLFQKGVSVQWNHRFDDLQSEEDSVVVQVEELEGTAMGYIVPHWETMVKKRFPIRARFVVGADGHNSLVRQRLGIKYEVVGRSQGFVACEFGANASQLDEGRIVLDEETTNVLWPLSDDTCRWTLQLIHSAAPIDFPEKERRGGAVAEKLLNENIKGNLIRLTHARAPWFSMPIADIHWCKQVSFQPGLAAAFGVDRCWLVGDAAHQTGPVGMQSLNAGLMEAQELATTLAKILRQNERLDSLNRYDQRAQARWRRLLGLSGELQAKPGTDIWTQRRAARILSCLPGCADDLPALAAEVGLEFASTPVSAKG